MRTAKQTPICAACLTAPGADASNVEKYLQGAYLPFVSEVATKDGSRAPDAASDADVRGFRRAPITKALFAANVGVFLAQIVLAGSPRFAVSMPGSILRWLGGNDSLSTIADTRLETLVTSCFLHASFLHLAFNLFALYRTGPLLERAVGPARFFTLYLGSGIAASASSAIWGRLFGQTLSVGASGAICGLIGATIVLGVRTEGWKSELALGEAWLLGLLLLVPLVRHVRGDIVQIDNAAHVGGAAGGAILAMTWRGAAYPMKVQRLIVSACVAVIGASSVTVYLRDRTDPYLFLDVEDRVRVAYTAFKAGDCPRARAAIKRAVKMDPQSVAVRQVQREIEAECRDGVEPDARD